MTKPLENIRVLDFTRFFAGPYCTMLLGDYGAEVIKIESLKGDEQRLQGPPFVGDQSTGFMAVNRNKKSVAIDLKSEKGKAIIAEMIKVSDVIVENFRTGVADRLGIGFKDAANINPSIIYCSISGYGDKGPNALDPAFDLTVQAFSGFMSINGLPDGEPVKPAVSIGDIMTGVYAFAAIEGAIIKRNNSQEKFPQLLTTSLFECISAFLVDAAVEYKLTGKERKALGSYHANIAPYGAYKAKDGYIAIGAGHTHIFKRLCELLDMKEFLQDETYMDTSIRYKNRFIIKKVLEEKLSVHGVSYWVKVLLDANIPAAPVNSIGKAIDSEQSNVMGMNITLKHELLGEMKLIGPAVKQPGVEIDNWTAPPVLGQDTKEVLKHTLHISEEEIENLIACGVIKSYK